MHKSRPAGFSAARKFKHLAQILSAKYENYMTMVRASDKVLGAIDDAISAARGNRFRARRCRTAAGGCINRALMVDDGDEAFFVKLNEAARLEMFVAEAAGLEALGAAGALRVPRPLCHGRAAGEAFLVLEHIELQPTNATIDARCGRQLAALHGVTTSDFGWHRDNTIGATPQDNGQESDWLLFWRRRRLGPQLELARRRGIDRTTFDRGQRLLSALGALFGGYAPVASLLHGDLWGGNYAADREGEPVIFDPAVYYGDREADLAMTELFGGFSRDFYAAYNDAWPLAPGYQVRRTLYNLYHILNHHNLFGGGYGGQARTMIDRLLAEIGH